MAEALEGLIERLTPWAMIEKWAPDSNGQLRIEPETANLLSSDLRTALHLLGEVEKALEEIADGKLPPDQHGHYLAHRKCVDVARSALDKLRKGMG